MKEEQVKVETKAFAFAKDIIKLVTSLAKNEIRFVLGKQLLRSGASIGANIEEAQGGLSRKEFIHSMNIAKKEAREALYWLRLLGEFDFAKKSEISKSINDCREILNILTAIVKTSQKGA